MPNDANQNVIVRATEEIFNQRNLDYIDVAYAPDYIGHAGEPAGEPRTRADLRAMTASLLQAFPDLRVRITMLVAEGDTVAWVRTSQGTHAFDCAGVAPTGKRVAWQSLVISHVLNGQIVAEWGSGMLLDQALKPA